MDTLHELQRWYHSQCNGDWEHGHGVRIDTLDNPGWSVTIDLGETDLAGRSFQEVKRLEPEAAWISCQIVDDKFEGHGGPLMLEEILRTFLAWANQ